MMLKADFHQLVFFSNPEHAGNHADRKKMQLYRGFGCIYAHKNENLQKTRVSATSWVFEYYISNIKKSKTQKTEGKLKSIT